MSWILRLSAATLALLLVLVGVFFIFEGLLLGDATYLAIISPTLITAALLGYAATTGRDPISSLRARGGVTLG